MLETGHEVKGYNTDWKNDSAIKSMIKLIIAF